MASLSAVAVSLGLSERALRLRIDALGAVIDGYIRRERYNALELTGDAVAMLHRLESLRRTQGMTLRQSAAQIRAEVDGDGAAGMPETRADYTSNTDVLRELLAVREAEVRRLEGEVERWHRHAERLQAKLDEVLQLALPSPRRPLLARAFSWLTSARN